MPILPSGRFILMEDLRSEIVARKITYMTFANEVRKRGKKEDDFPVMKRIRAERDEALEWEREYLNG